jgi:hypothetical protein
MKFYKSILWPNSFYYNKLIWKELAYAKSQNGAAPMHVTPFVGDVYLNLEHLCIF